MSKRLLLTIMLFLILFSGLTYSADAFTSESGVTGNVWSPPEQAATFILIDMERGSDGIIHLLGYTGLKPYYKLEYAQRDLAGNWSSPETIDDDMGSDRPLAGDLAIGSDGTAHVIYLDNPGGGDHYVEYAQRSPAGTWTTGIPISDPSQDAFGVTLILLRLTLN